MPRSKIRYVRKITWHWPCQETGPAAPAPSAEQACATVLGKSGLCLFLGLLQPRQACPHPRSIKGRCCSTGIWLLRGAVPAPLGTAASGVVLLTLSSLAEDVAAQSQPFLLP